MFFDYYVPVTEVKVNIFPYSSGSTILDIRDLKGV